MRCVTPRPAPPPPILPRVAAIAPYVPRLIETCTLVLKHEGSITVKKALGNALGFVFRDTSHAEVWHELWCDVPPASRLPLGRDRLVAWRAL